MLDTHAVVIEWDDEIIVDWGDPNDASDSTFALEATRHLSPGDAFASSTDGATLTVESVDAASGAVGFTVAAHQYLDDGPAPGNSTAQDEYDPGDRPGR